MKLVVVVDYGFGQKEIFEDVHEWYIDNENGKPLLFISKNNEKNIAVFREWQYVREID